MKNTTTINVAREFSRFPGGRFFTDGQFSGQRFREELLEPVLRNHPNVQVTVELDGTLGFGSSFLEEAFGGLVRLSGFNASYLKNFLVLKSENDILLYTIRCYIEEAKSKELA